MLENLNGIDIEFKILDKRLVNSPEYKTAGAAGLDLCAMLEDDNEMLVVNPGEAILISTGIALNIKNPSIAAVLLPRSGKGHKEGIVLGNLVGLIDSDYQGPVMVSCWNRGSEPQIVKQGERFAQMVFLPIIRANLIPVDEFDSKTARGAGGFGHTGG